MTQHENVRLYNEVKDLLKHTGEIDICRVKGYDAHPQIGVGKWELRYPSLDEVGEPVFESNMVYAVDLFDLYDATEEMDSTYCVPTIDEKYHKFHWMELSDDDKRDIVDAIREYIHAERIGKLLDE